MQYKLYGLIVETQLQLQSASPIAEKEKGKGNQIDVTIVPGELIDVKKEANTYIKQYGEINKVGEPLWLVENLTRERCDVVVIRAGAFRVTLGTKIEYNKAEHASEVYFEQSILIFCMALIMIQRERIVLHGSGLIYRERLIVISGESGSGKSTLTNELLKHECGFMADDAVAIEITGNKVYGYGTFPLRRLCSDVMMEQEFALEDIIYMPDGGKDKYGIDMKGRYYDQKTRLGAIFIVQPMDVESVNIQRIEGAECIKHITDNLYKKASYKRIGFTPHMMMQCMSIAKNIPIYVIKRPIVGMTVKEQVKLIQELSWELL